METTDGQVYPDAYNVNSLTGKKYFHILKRVPRCEPRVYCDVSSNMIGYLPSKQPW